MQSRMLISGSTYHVFSKSISGYNIFCNGSEFMRMRQVFSYYKTDESGVKFSQSYINKPSQNDKQAKRGKETVFHGDSLVEIIAYCIMPTHIHLILKQLKEKGIFNFMRNSLISYTKYFNLKHNRKGPLWEARFKRVEVVSDEQLIHLTRYIHLNPVTAYLTDRPEKWQYSSYNEYVTDKVNNKLCTFKNMLGIDPRLYKKFVENQIDYQRNLAKIKRMVFDENSTS
ncbi:MAG: transposase [Candidatus Omnitrophota bacterium]